MHIVDENVGEGIVGADLELSILWLKTQLLLNLDLHLLIEGHLELVHLVLCIRRGRAVICGEIDVQRIFILFERRS